MAQNPWMIRSKQSEAGATFSPSESPQEKLAAALREKGWQHKRELYEPFFESVTFERNVFSPTVSIIVISWRLHHDNLKSFQQLQKERSLGFELIFVDNGAAEGEFDALRPFVDTYVKLNANTGAYLARNVGSLFAKAPVLLFLEDDGVPFDDFVGSHLDVHNRYDIVAARGVYVPKSDNPHNQRAKHYYLGDTEFPIFADVEGNASYCAVDFFTVGGWDDNIRFGGGGIDLSLRLLYRNPDMRKQIYTPGPKIWHDYVRDDDHLKTKLEKQKKSRARLSSLHPGYDRVIPLWQQLHGRNDLLIPKGESCTLENRAPWRYLPRPSISILIPTYNRAKYILETVQSALSQTVPVDEIIVVDDGSTDNTIALVRSLNEPRVRVVAKEHSGAPKTRNRALTEARGEFILWLDSDDLLLPETVEHYLNALRQFPDSDVLYGNLVIINDQHEPQRPVQHRDWYHRNEQLLGQMLLENPIPNSGTMIKKCRFAEHGGMNEEFRRAHDYEWWTRVADKLAFKHVNQNVLLWRWHDSNMSTGTVKVDFSFDARIVQSLLDRYDLKTLFPSLDWETIPESHGRSVAYLQLAQRFLNMSQLETGLDYLKRSQQLTPNGDVEKLIRTVEAELMKQQGAPESSFCEPPALDEKKTSLKTNKPAPFPDSNGGKGRVLIACDYWHPSSGGTELMVSAMARGFREAGWRVDVLTRELPQRSEYLVDGVTIRDLPVAGMQAQPGAKRETILRDLREGVYDAAFAVAAPTCWVPWFFAEFKGDAPRIYHVTCINAVGFSNWKLKPSFREPLTTLFKQARGGVITITGESYDTRFCYESGIPFQFIPNGVDKPDSAGSVRDELALKPGTKLLLHVGNFFAVKNQIGLMESLQSLEGDWRLVMLGNPVPGLEDYYHRAKQMASGDERFTILTGKSREEVAAAMEEAELLLLSSDGEGAPLVLLEAMSHGLPWIARETCGGAHEYMGGIIAPLYEFSETIKTLLESPALRESLGEAGRSHYESTYQMDTMIGRYVDALEQRPMRQLVTANEHAEELTRNVRQQLQARKIQNKPALSIIVLDDKRGQLRRTLVPLAPIIETGCELVILSDRPGEATTVVQNLNLEHVDVHHFPASNLIDVFGALPRVAGGNYLLPVLTDAPPNTDAVSALYDYCKREHRADIVLAGFDALVELPEVDEEMTFSGHEFLPVLANLAELPLAGFAFRRDVLATRPPLDPACGELAWQQFWAQHADDLVFASLPAPVAQPSRMVKPENLAGNAGKWLVHFIFSKYGGEAFALPSDPRIPSTMNQDVLANVARSIARTGDFDEASRLIESAPSAPSLTLGGQILLQQDAKTALALFDQALEFDPLYLPLFNLMRGLESQLPAELKNSREEKILKEMRQSKTHESLLKTTLKLTQFLDAPRAIAYLIERLMHEEFAPAAPVHSENPDVTVVVPFYNGKEEFVRQTLESIVAQTFESWECIVVDDGSSDGSFGFVEKWMEKQGNPRFRTLRQENRGLSGARNTGFREAKGEFVTCIDADDFVHPDFLRQLRAAFEDEPDIGWIYPLTVQFGKFNRIWGTDTFHPLYYPNVNRNPASAMIRRSMWKDIGGFNEDMREGYEDWDFWLAALEHGWRSGQVRDILFFYRKLDSSLNEDIDRQREVRIKRDIAERYPLCYKTITRENEALLDVPRAFPSELVRKEFLATWRAANRALRQHLKSKVETPEMIL